MSINDPKWGNRGGGDNQGPPDLEELWRDFNRRLSGMFGRQPGRGGDGGGDSGGGDRMPELNFRQFGGGVGLILALAVVIWLASGFYIVDASQRGIVLQFGRFVEATEPGLRWRLPYPVQTHELVNQTGVRTVEIGYRGSERNKVLKEALMLTDDENIVNIQFAVQYILKDPQQYLFNNRNADDSVIQAAETAVREVVGKSKMDFVLYEGREQVAANAHKLMQDILDRYATGIQISKVTMQNAQPPEQVQAAFDDAVKAGQDRERQKNEGQAYANDVIPRARGTASRLLEEADAYKGRVVAQAEGDASRFRQIYTEYAKAPEVTRQRMYLETMQQIMSNSSKVVIDSKGSGNLLYLPLDKLIAATAAQASGAATPEAAAQTRPQVPAAAVAADNSPAPPRPDALSGESRTREAMRNRERGDR
ncbi:MAG TPA: FtsH protease activity modulator HflK [Rhodocyclaceae bacterium]|nr:FtsH protease activity modulator HflK [Rhodocyclaceae bacterium]HNA66179.1 FtsH protease activity modulator HflK [Rhodocyclaceae bacterium]HNI80298.1 FtsH protease activity modulator HflK [Rhodocyclaceae bacterium]